MRYLLLLTNTSEAVSDWERFSPEEKKALREDEIPKWGAFMQWAEEQGIKLQGLELDVPATAKTLQSRNGEVLVTDGPYLETKEILGGYFIAECDDLDRAIEIASRIPVASTGSVEIRPLLEPA
jgi:hypothetical protein